MNHAKPIRPIVPPLAKTLQSMGIENGYTRAQIPTYRIGNKEYIDVLKWSEEINKDKLKLSLTNLSLFYQKNKKEDE